MKKLLLFATSLLISAYCSAQWSNDPAVNTPVSLKSNNESQVTSVSDGSGGTIIAWAEYTGSIWQIYAQKLSSTGTKQWGSTGVRVTETTDMTQFPMLTPDGNGGVFVAWTQSKSMVIGSDDIYAQRLNAAGNKLWGNTGIAVCTAAHTQILSNIITDSSGNLLLSWGDFSNASNVYVQKINGNGEAQWAANGLAVVDLSGFQFGFILEDPTGGYIVLWQETIEGDTYDTSKIYWQKLNADGSRKTQTNTLIFDFPASSTSLTVNGIASDGNGGLYFAIVAEEPANARLYLQHVNASGATTFNSTSWGIEVDSSIGEVVSGGFTLLNYELVMDSDGNGGVILGWSDMRSGLDGFYAQRYNSNGTKLWNQNDVQLLSGSISYTGDFGVLKNAGGDYVFLLTKSESGNYSKYYVQKVSPAGVIQYTTNGLPVATANSAKSGNMISTGDLIVLTWSDNRAGTSNEDIYAQSVYPSGTLPVDFIDFKASANNNRVILNWATASESNNSSFVIEKSENGKDFFSIGSVKGAGTTSEKNTYNFTDPIFTSGTLYYRIKQIDNDGRFDYSEIRSVKISSLNNVSSITYFPNPVKDVLNISLNSSEELISKYSILDYSGRLIKESTLSVPSNTYNIDLSGLINGAYILNVTSSKGIHQGKIIKD